MSRFFLRCRDDGSTEVYDATTGAAVYGPACWESASREAAERNKPQPPAATCRERALVQVAECCLEALVLILPSLCVDQRAAVEAQIARAREIMEGKQ